MSFGLCRLNGIVDLYWLQFDNVALYIVNSITGSLFVIQLCKNVNFRKIEPVLKFISINSLIIMCT